MRNRTSLSHKRLLVKRTVAHLDKGGTTRITWHRLWRSRGGVIGFEPHTISSALDNKILTS
jgi:hypothetical protein